MNFIEQIFHLAPDGGSGATEWALALAILGACLLLVGRIIGGRSARRLPAAPEHE